MREKISLDGFWQKSINDRAFVPQQVPYSDLCVGNTLLKRTFPGRTGERAVLCFEGITYRAEVTLNGAEVGSMLPYCRYRFEAGALLRENNELTVTIHDRGMKYGPAEGWENYGGIVRSVYLEYLNNVSVEDAFWHVEFSNNYHTAHCTLEISAPGASRVQALLTDAAGDEIAACEGPVQENAAVLRFDVEKPLLWSPEAPQLYQLKVCALDEQGQCCDEICQRVGFREFCAKGRQFCLNGAPYFLKGVCRHDMWGQQGHTLTDAQIRRDLTMMKAAGFNFVRLVHYPHDARVLDMADEIGLFVSEESGLWWSDVTDPEVYQPALEVMERTILRDRSHACVAFWLSFNECVFTEEFLRRATQVCKRFDPYRMVSGANCMNPAKTKEIFTAAGFDFYSFHPYGPDETTIMGGIDAVNPHQSIENVYNTLDDKPLLFTEWGGSCVEDNEFVFTRMVKNLIRANREGRLAGFSYWEWADMYEFGRGEPGCFQGILREGMVDTQRNPHEILYVFSRLLGNPGVLEEDKPQVRVGCFAVPSGHYTPLSLTVDAQAQDAAWEKMMKQCVEQRNFRNKPIRRMKHGPAMPVALHQVGSLPMEIPAGRPLVIVDTLELPLALTADALFVVGNVTLPWGWPQYGQKGELAGEYTLIYADGEEIPLALRNGEEITGAIAYAGPSRLNPLAQHVEQALFFTYDLNWEHYVAQLMRIPLLPKPLKALRVTNKRPDSALLLYGISAYIGQ